MKRRSANPAGGDPQQRQLYMPPATYRYWKDVPQIIPKENRKVYKIMHSDYARQNLKQKNKNRGIKKLIGSPLR